MSEGTYKKEIRLTTIFSESVKYFIANIQLIVALTVILCFPFNLFSRFFAIDVFAVESINGYSFLDIVFLLLFIALSVLMSSISVMSIAYAIKKGVNNTSVSVKKTLNKTLLRLIDGIKTQVMVNIFLIGLFFLFIVPGIIYSIYWMFAMIVVVVKNKSGKEALDYSKDVVRGRWWKLFVYMIILSLPVIFVSAIVSILTMFSNGNIIVLSLIDSVISFIAMFLYVVISVLFLNLDVARKQ